jgi:uncharacterized protein
MPAVISDTSVINYLGAIGKVDLLRLQFGTVFVPPSVWRELHARLGLPGTAPADEARASGWLVIQQPLSGEMLTRLSADLDPGEAEAIALACELKPAIVLLDEAEGRAFACAAGLTVIGTVGILMSARQNGQVQRLRPLLDRLMQELRFRLGRELYEQLVAGDETA